MKKLVALLVCLIACSPVFAQNISVDLKDAPVRTTLEMMFKQAGIKNYVIDNSVSGFITMKLTDLEFENSLKIVMRNSFPALTYTKENDVWIVKQRIVTPIPQTAGPDPVTNVKNNTSWERIPLTFIDPVDLMSVFGNILLINQFQRPKGGMNGGFGGGRNF
jgi:hypothetical protein